MEFLLQNGAHADISTPSERPPVDEEEDMRRSHSLEAVLSGKIQNISALLHAGAEAQAVMNPEKQISILYQCAEYSFEDIPTLEKFLARGVGIDTGPLDFKTLFACGVRNRYLKLAAFLRKRGADPNALYRMALMDSATRPSTVLARLANENSQGSLSCLPFLLNKSIQTSANLPAVSLIVEPSCNHTVFHILATLPRDTQDALATRLALFFCADYFSPAPADLNQQALPVDTNDPCVEWAGGNTSLHLAVVSANYKFIRRLLLSTGENAVDTSICNSSGFTPPDLAALVYPEFQRRFRSRIFEA